jgi:hypothetical protein
MALARLVMVFAVLAGRRIWDALCTLILFCLVLQAGGDGELVEVGFQFVVVVSTLDSF